MEIKNLEDVTIENMMTNIFSNGSIKKRKKEIVDFYRPHFATDLFGSSPEAVTEEQLAKHIDKVLKDDKTSADPYLSYKDGKYYRARRRGRNIEELGNNATADSNYVGKAGECSVMAELLFNGYNVNNMMVDEGIDLVASKDNVFYYIQVKTRLVAEANRFHFSIRQGNYDRYVGTQMRYVLVARAMIANEIRNIFFVFANGDINRFRHEGILGDSDTNININIEYDTRTGKAYAYSGRNRTDVSYYMNKFDLS